MNSHNSHHNYQSSRTTSLHHYHISSSRLRSSSPPLTHQRTSSQLSPSTTHQHSPFSADPLSFSHSVRQISLPSPPIFITLKHLRRQQRHQNSSQHTTHNSPTTRPRTLTLSHRTRSEPPDSRHVMVKSKQIRPALRPATRRRPCATRRDL